MPTLNEYLGTIVSSISNARVMSDLQTSKIAEEYAKHDILKHFTIPRMRISDVEVEFKVAIDELDEEIIYPVNLIDNRDLNKSLYAEVTKSLGVKSLPKPISQKVLSVLSDRTKILETKLNQTKKLSQVDTFGEVVKRDLTTILQTEDINTEDFDPDFLQQRIKTVTDRNVRLSLDKNTIGNMSVVAEAASIKEIPADNLLTIKMTVNEDGMEWVQTEDADGNIKRQLLPE